MKKILVIEDEKDIREIISALHSEEGFIVYTAKNGRDGITIAQSELPNLIICDIMMPGMDGYSVLKELSKNDSAKSIPFIFLTAKVERNDIRLGMELGADDYLFKPFKSEELLKSISSRLNRIETLKGVFTKAEESPSPKKYTIDDKIFIHANGSPHLIKINEILFIVAERQYSSINLLDGKSYLLRKSISKWEELLPCKNFLRIHRSTIINIDYLVKMEKWYNSSFLVHLKNVPESFEISKRYATKLRQNTV
ncbi:MAG: response regulator transcription factor [Bacteroidetes bacterium]|nr:response regulator transcription factor [Bacteroidota bacterium]